MSLKPSEYERTQEVVHTCPECKKKWTKRYMTCARPKRMKYCAACRALLFPARPQTQGATPAAPPAPQPGSADDHRANDYKLKQAGDE